MKIFLFGIFAIIMIIAAPSYGDDLTNAIDSGYIDQVRDILRDAPERLNQKNDAGLTPLNLASYLGHIDIVNHLLELGADVTIGDNENSQPSHNAAVAGHFDVIERLVAAGADIDARDDNNNTALLFALKFRHPETARSLIDAGADVTIRDNHDASPLHYAVLRNQPDMVKELLARGADLNHQTRSGRTALSFAVGSNLPGIAEILLQAGADTEIPEEYGRTPLLYAARETGNADMAALLIRYGADVNAGDRFSDTPLVLSSWRGFRAFAELLLDNGAEVEITGHNGEELLNYSIEKGLDRLFTKLIDAGIDLNIGNRTGSSLLHAAAQGGSVAIIQSFLDRGYDIAAADVYGWTPLHYAAGKGRTEAARLLIEKGADVNARTISGLSAYNLAAKKNRTEIMNLLVAANADRSPQTFPEYAGPYFGQTPPGNEPELFAPDVVSTNRHGHSSITFSPDGTEAYWSAYFYPADSGYAESALQYSRIDNGRWTIPVFPEFTEGIETNDDVPLFSRDGSKLYFMSRRPMTPGGQGGRAGVWMVEKNEAGWGEPYPAPGNVNDIGVHWQFTLSNAETIYIQGERDDSHGLSDIYSSRFIDGIYQTPENMGPIINTGSSETSPYIAPDESFVLFASGGHNSDSSNGRMYIYISFKTADGQWGQPVATGLMGLCPLISHDGNYLFYNGRYDGIRGIFWVDASILDDLKPTAP